MNKITTALLFFSLPSITLFSQDQPSITQHRLALDLGISSSKDISFSDFYNDDSRIYAGTIGLQYSVNLSGIHWLTTGIGYYQAGDTYNYYTGINSERTDVRIHVNVLKFPFLYSLQFNQGKAVNFFMRVGPSLDFVIGESIINPEKSLNNPDGFRENVTQGDVKKNQFALLNLSAGLNFKNENGVAHYLEFSYNGTMHDMYRASTFDGSKSTYRNMGVKFGITLFNK